MRHKPGKSIVSGILLVLTSFHADAGETGKLTIRMNGIEAYRGQAVFVLMDSRASHHGDAPIYLKKTMPVTDNAVAAHFELPVGEYSAVVYHDLNTNARLDTNWFGKPKESYGFSNNARGRFGIPDFSASRFTIDSGHIQLSITVK